jgi:hypothetical protein
VRRIARIDHDRVDSGRKFAVIDRSRRAAPSVVARGFSGEEIASAARMVPERTIELPALTAVAAHEQTSRNRAGVHRAWLGGVPEGQIPDLEQRGVLVLRALRDHFRIFSGKRHVLRDVARALGILDRRRVLPGLSAITRPRQLGTPVSVIEAGPQGPVAWVACDETHVHAGVHDAPRFPTSGSAVDDDYTFARCEQDSVRHRGPPFETAAQVRRARTSCHGEHRLTIGPRVPSRKAGRPESEMDRG